MYNYVTEIKKIMRQNTRGVDEHLYTVPSPDIYPFQWLWDSCFHAYIYAHFDVARAEEELRSVLSKPLLNGLLPHIIYWQKEDERPNWGREFRGDIINQTWKSEGTSTLTQPPLIATTILDLYKKSGNKSFLEETYPILRAYYNYLLRERDPEKRGLVGIVNPDESGMDNSPRFDEAQDLPIDHTDNENLDRRIARIIEYQDCSSENTACMREHFWIEGVAFNSIFCKSLNALSEIAGILGKKEDRQTFVAASTRTREAIRTQMCTNGICRSLWLNKNKEREYVNVATWSIFSPLYAEILNKHEARRLVQEYLLNEEMFWSTYPVPSTAMNEPTYDAGNFWRGPVWMAPNWFIYKGLRAYGFDDIARTIKEKSIALFEKSGCREYYHPQTGAGLGAQNFTWGGLIIDME